MQFCTKLIWVAVSEAPQRVQVGLVICISDELRHRMRGRV